MNIFISMLMCRLCRESLRISIADPSRYLPSAQWCLFQYAAGADWSFSLGGRHRNAIQEFPA